MARELMQSEGSRVLYFVHATSSKQGEAWGRRVCMALEYKYFIDMVYRANTGGFLCIHTGPWGEVYRWRKRVKLVKCEIGPTKRNLEIYVVWEKKKKKAFRDSRYGAGPSCLAHSEAKNPPFSTRMLTPTTIWNHILGFINAKYIG